MRKIKSFFGITAWLVAIMLLALACNDDLDINKVYAFDLVYMPVQKKIVQGKTAVIRCRLVNEGQYKEVKYFIRYFQSDGVGELRLNNGTAFSQNDRYPLTKTEFNLYYTSHCEDQQSFDIYIEDNFGQQIEKTFSFQNEKGEEVTPVSIKFEFTTLPIQNSLTKGDSAEIRCTIKKEDEKNDTKYSIRYFQSNGIGELKLDGVTLNPNDLYDLKEAKFNLFYVSRSDVKQSIDVFIVDSYGQTIQKTFNFDPIVPETEPEIDYSFEFYTLPVQKLIGTDETVEIRCQIKRTDLRNNRSYRIRYFQPDGKGELSMNMEFLIAPNDLYLLQSDVFRLYYTSRSEIRQVIDVYIEDNHGQVVQKTFSWQNDKGAEED